MSETNIRRVCVFFDADAAEEVWSESARLGLSRSSLLQEAWRISRQKIREEPSLPSTKDDQGDDT